MWRSARTWRARQTFRCGSEGAIHLGPPVHPHQPRWLWGCGWCYPPLFSRRITNSKSKHEILNRYLEKIFTNGHWETPPSAAVCFFVILSLPGNLVVLSFDAVNGSLALAAERKARLFAKMSPATKVTMRLLKLGSVHIDLSTMGTGAGSFLSKRFFFGGL